MLNQDTNWVSLKSYATYREPDSGAVRGKLDPPVVEDDGVATTETSGGDTQNKATKPER